MSQSLRGPHCKMPIADLSPEQRRAQNDEYQAMHGMVGTALSRWVDIERQLTQTFRYATTYSYTGEVVHLSHLLAQVLAKSSSFRQRLELVDAAVVARLGHQPETELKMEWKALVKRVTKLSEGRNKLAHRQAVVVTTGSFEPKFEGDLAVRLAEPLPKFDSNSPTYIDDLLNDGITSAGLKVFAVDFNAAAHALYEHGLRLQNHVSRSTG